jgi:hypothetical protein
MLQKACSSPGPRVQPCCLFLLYLPSTAAGAHKATTLLPNHLLGSPSPLFLPCAPIPGSLSFQFLMLCALACPGAYTDTNLLHLIELLCRTGLDVGLRLLPKTDLQHLLLLLVESIQEWPGKVRRLLCEWGPGHPRVP